MAEADFGFDYTFSGFPEATAPGERTYLRAVMTEQLDRLRLLEIFENGIVRELINLHLRMGQLRYPETIAAEVAQLEEMLDAAIENAHVLADEIAPHVLFQIGLKAAVCDLFRSYADDCGLRYYINIADSAELLDEGARLVLYNLVKRLSGGVVRTCQAGTVGLTMEVRGGEVELVIQDNGSLADDFRDMAFTGACREPAFLLEAGEQVKCLGGKLWIDKAAGMRTIWASIPLLPAHQV